jgi:hypothetical protein
MLSGTGRHRRPRQAPALIVTAGVTGAGLALPLLGAGSAQAVGDETWDAAAECESGGEWDANTGSGFYGGLRLTLELWEEYGGREFAERPDLAGREQQIAVAERVLAGRGYAGFSGCALLTGLWQEFREEQEQELESGGDPDAPAPAPDGGDGACAGGEAGGGADGFSDGVGRDWSTSTTRSGADGCAAGGGADDAGRPDQDGPSPGPEPPAEDDAGGAGDEAAGGGAPSDAGEQGGSYVVRSGDTLSAVAAELDVPGGWPALYQWNKTVIGDDPDYILPGQWLDLTVTGR